MILLCRWDEQANGRPRSHAPDQKRWAIDTRTSLFGRPLPDPLPLCFHRKFRTFALPPTAPVNSIAHATSRRVLSFSLSFQVFFFCLPLFAPCLNERRSQNMEGTNHGESESGTLLPRRRATVHTGFHFHRTGACRNNQRPNYGMYGAYGCVTH
jgi:hypothetical protein